jgi:hypothetical protein
MQLKEELMSLRRSNKAKDVARLSASLRSKRELRENNIVNNRIHAARNLAENCTAREKQVVAKHDAAAKRLKEQAELLRVQQRSKVIKNAEMQARVCRNRLSYQRHLEDVQRQQRLEAAEKVRERINRANLNAIDGAGL